MKKFLTVLLACVMVISLAACGSGKTDNGGDTQSDADVLKVGMECNYAPYNWSQSNADNGAVPIKNVDNMYTNGYDVQVAIKIAESMGKTLEIYSYEWDSLIPAVQSGKLDMIIAGMSPTSERREKIDFSDLYYTSNLVVITKKDSETAGITTIRDLDGKNIAAQSGTFHLTALEAQTAAKANEMSDFSTMLIALDAGTIDGYIAEEPTAMAVCTEGSQYTYVPLVNNDTGFEVSEDDTSIAVGVKKGSTELLSSINGFIKGFDSAAQRELMQKMVEIAPVEQ